jgi:hypothetical protein
MTVSMAAAATNTSATLEAATLATSRAAVAITPDL